jgi:DNA-binding transcriptional regulator YhcF (GntR family)
MNVPLLILNHGSPVPPYEQISLQLRTMIALAHLLPGEQLPSVRQLARDLGVAPNTVVRAYTELERDGWVETSARKGVKVAARPPEITEEERQSRLTSAVDQLFVTVHQLGVSAEAVRTEVERHLEMLGQLEAGGHPR